MSRPLIALVLSTALFAAPALGADPLAAWSDGPAKKSIVEFFEKVTKHGSRDFVPEPERIAVFDNDGTLWAEQPLYFQLTYIVSGGGIEFMRPWTDKVYGVPPEQVIGSTIRTNFEQRDGSAADRSPRSATRRRTGSASSRSRADEQWAQPQEQKGAT